MNIISENLGTAFMGSLLTAVLFGITCMQALSYAHYCRSDNSFLLATVLFLIILDLVHTGFVAHLVYTFVVTDFDDILKLEVLPWSLPSSVLLHLLSDTIIRTFFIRRIWFLSKRNYVVTGFLGILLLSSFAFVILLEVRSFGLHNVLKLSTIRWEVYTSLSFTMSTDLFITVAMCFYLFRSRNGHKATNSVLNTLCIYTINTGLLTTLWSLGCLVAYACKPESFFFLAFYLPESKFYTNAFLASLNARHTLREKARASDYISQDGLRLGSVNQRIHMSGGDSNRNSELEDTKAVQINVVTEIQSSDDPFRRDAKQEYDEEAQYNI
ncbi:hypothetical protein SCHPADRAFT_935206 [Schizopora paradoxa]|uniref:DUF6534 domain-containing protein n=1 Tax=Schizopora paradoxa TaxID=27342 RepID=A0A0H2S613_9AGAM|nr:hypothetical protein SCHPADRAFT_935206 [Schizopora paradoxa]